MLSRSAVPIALVLLLRPAPAPADQGLTSETHRKNVGKIVFAGERMRMDAQDRIALRTSFRYGDPIYGRVYLPKGLDESSRDKGCPNPSLAFRMRAFVDGVDKGIVNAKSFESRDWTTVQVTLRLTPGDDKDRMNIDVPEMWETIVSSLSPGPHKVRLEFLAGDTGKGCPVKLADGEFAFEKTDKAAGPAGAKLPAPLMKDAKLEGEMVRAVKDRGWKNEEPVKVVILERDWRMVRDPFGTITHREINTHVVLRKVVDGSFRANDISFRQEARRGGAWGPTEVYGIGTKSYPVDPAEVR
jgi:hypothetical protein